MEENHTYFLLKKAGPGDLRQNRVVGRQEKDKEDRKRMRNVKKM